MAELESFPKVYWKARALSYRAVHQPKGIDALYLNDAKLKVPKRMDQPNNKFNEHGE